MKQRAWILSVLGVVTMLAAACAKPVDSEPLPAHAFPNWVGQLEIGRTHIDDVSQRFGPPDEIEQGMRGGLTWRYAFHEVAWPDNDPMRPVVAADGTVVPRSPSAWARVGHGFRTAGGVLDRLFFFPPRQPRPPRTRQLPATIHQLEVSFGVDGTLRHFRYTPTPGATRVPAER